MVCINYNLDRLLPDASNHSSLTVQFKTKYYQTVTSSVIVWVRNAIRKTRSQAEIMKELGKT